MDDLITFLRAQLDEDERAARAATNGPWTPWRRSTVHGLGDLIHAVLTPGQKPGSRAEIVTASWLDAEHIARHDPARVLREIDAKRQLLRAHGRPHECIALTGSGDRSVVDGQPWELWEPEHTSDHGPCTTLRLLALPYADRPGYREEWRP